MNTKILIFVILMLPLSLTFGQNLGELNVLQVSDEQISNSKIAIYASNSAHAPLTIVIDFPIKKNVILSQDIPYTYVIPANTKKALVMELEMIPGKNSNYSYSYTYNLGDTQNATHNDDFVYQLPFESTLSCKVGQGYHGIFSHHNISALDFNMEIGTKILAARGGVVAFVKENSKKGCMAQGCEHDANFIFILHDDGSFSQYVHLQKNGSIVKPGQVVQRGEHIGFSGNTGWSSGPHLHFEVFIPKGQYYQTVPTKFKTSKSEAEFLTEGKVYSR